ncbi:MAG TPA: FG-GAP-like repeat-containing protein [Vicinamibacterales bacterium]|nr:FG-GAP-like repeat-containing protein [Vicinamibacterales bacterium]
MFRVPGSKFVFGVPAWTIVSAVVGLVLLLVGSVMLWRAKTALPAPGSAAYEETTRAFYHGLAALEVGLLDDARRQFASATMLVPQEPASWANLGLAQLRLGELDAAADPIQRALALAPNNGDVVLLAGRMETARGRLDEGIARLRQAVALDPTGLRTRFALAEELSRLPNAAADAEAEQALDELAKRAPRNLAVMLERARLAARRRDAQRLRDSVAALATESASWTEQAKEQFARLQKAAADGDVEQAPRAATILRNVLAPVPAFSESLAAVRTPAELIAEPFDRFLVLASPMATPSPADTSVVFTPEEPLGAATGAPISTVSAFSLTVDGLTAIVAADATTLRRVDGAAGSWPFASLSANTIAALDWNHDFRTDIAVVSAGEVHLLLQQQDGSFTDATSTASAGSSSKCECVGIWAADVEMDGDLDLVAGPSDGPPFVLRNNGNGTWRMQQPFADLSRVRGFAWADLDGDADPDAMFLDESGTVRVYVNRQAGAFARLEGFTGPAKVIATTVADLNADGAIDVIALDASGVVRLTSRSGDAWTVNEIARWSELTGTSVGSHRLIAADLDNNGALDLIAAGTGASRIWLADAHHALQPLPSTLQGAVSSVLDLNGDGTLDLVGVSAGRAARWLGRGGAGYHWKTIRPRAQQNAGDQRINAFGVGGEIEVRAGLLVQKQVMTGGPVHFGLGTHTTIDVTRIVWPNGVPQAEFRIGVDDAIVAEQRLKGSCPWVFAWDGSRMGFVTDFLWRSPLGLRINAQDTAGVSQTEDWVKITGPQLVPRDGVYDVRITAELWETHFFDHVSLMVVDHPADTDVFVDERFSPAHPPSLAVHTMGKPSPVARAWDERGRDVTDLVARQDGRYLASFERGEYQGIAQEHYVEFELGRDIPASARVTLVATGWIYPTDSSINVAIGQGGHVKPSPVSLEAQGPDGRWSVVKPDVGFPAGKNKTMLVDLDGVSGAARLRLRTNLEIYWDRLAVAERSDAAVSATRIQPSSAELRFRGYSETTSPRGESPETPIYERLSNTTQRWRDLVGYYTRFGSVKALLAGIDDRYVIMNAGDELRLQFPELAPSTPGWRRDFVLIGDGWEKDGDYNTGFSQTVLPLPSHSRPDYGSAPSTLTLEDDPVYQRHRDDWEQYHTRFVTPSAFIRGLRR